jgi:hypothetical protein
MTFIKVSLKTPEKQRRSCIFRAIDAGDEKQVWLFSHTHFQYLELFYKTVYDFVKGGDE